MLSKIPKETAVAKGSALAIVGGAIKTTFERTPKPMSKEIEVWYRKLRAALNVGSSPPEAIKSAFQDARTLFGTNFDTKVTLRDAGHHGANEDIILHQFDPNFVSKDVYCRDPSCGNRKPEAPKEGKRDLYLCPLHRENLITSIENAFAMRKIDIPKRAENLEDEQFTGYTWLIGLLEHAYQNSKKFGSLKKGSTTTTTMEEAILNVRNVLIITSTIVCPDNDHLALILPYVISILQLILEKGNSVVNFVDALVYFLREVIEMILSAFGVIYTWVSLALHSPGVQITAGLAGTIGLAFGIFFGPWGAAYGMGAGLLLGGLTANGIYNTVVGDPRQQAIDRFRQDWSGVPDGQPHQHCVVYCFEGNAFGELSLRPILIRDNNHQN